MDLVDGKAPVPPALRTLNRAMRAAMGEGNADVAAGCFLGGANWKARSRKGNDHGLQRALAAGHSHVVIRLFDEAHACRDFGAANGLIQAVLKADPPNETVRCALIEHVRASCPSSGADVGWDWQRGARIMAADRSAPEYVYEFIDGPGKNLDKGEMAVLGFDEGNSVRAFQKAGWRIHAVDGDDACFDRIREQLDAGTAIPHRGLVQDIELPSGMGLYHASHNLLSFLEDHLPPTLKRLFDTTLPEGYLLGCVIAPGHDWEQAKRGGLATFTRDEIIGLLGSAGYEGISAFARDFDYFIADNGRLIERWRSWKFCARKPKAPPAGDADAPRPAQA
ncbi:MAG: hypothetical protein ABW032_06835 [Burkholderiaceae bacterium]